MQNLIKRINSDVLVGFGLLLTLAARSPDQRWCAVYISSCIILVGLFKKDVWVPRLGIVGVLLVPVIAWGFYLGNTIPGHYMFQLIDWTCFGILMIAGLNSTSLSPLFKANQLGTIACLGLGVYQYFMEPERYPASLLLHQNITSQFLAASLLLQIASKRYSLVGLTLVHLYMLYCRSIWVALAVVVVLFVLRKERYNFKDIKAVLKQIGVAVFIGALLTLSTNTMDPVSPTHGGIHTSKGDSTDIRLVRWGNTLKMIQDNPLGVGPGNYEWGYSAYAKTDPEHKPRLNIRSPHNGYLELAVEWGIPAAVLFILALAIVLRKMYRNGLVASFLVLNMVDAFFAFPMELGFSFYIMAFMFGYGLKDWSSFRPLAIQARTIMVVVLFVVACYGIRMTLAEIYEESKTVRGFQKACVLKPADWQSCINLGVNQLKQKDYNGAVKTFDNILKDRPHMHPAIYLKYQTLAQAGKKEEASKAADLYLKYFPDMVRK